MTPLLAIPATTMNARRRSKTEIAVWREHDLLLLSKSVWSSLPPSACWPGGSTSARLRPSRLVSWCPG